jgi:dolichol-phosphate mannosyltransferase
VLKRIHPEWYFHAAVHGAYSSQTNPFEMVHTNIEGTMHLLNAAKQVGFEAFINTGSSSEYGYKPHAPKETEWLEPNSYYAITKAAATHYCHYIGATEKLPVYTLRLYSVYGPWEEPTRLMPTLIREALQGKLPPLVNPSIARDYISVDDVVRAFFTVASTKQQDFGAVYNVATGKQTTLRQLVALVSRLLVVKQKPHWGSMPDRAWDTTCWVGNSQLLQRVTSWQAKDSLESGILKMIAWQRQQLG